MEMQPECHACLTRLVELTVVQAHPDPAVQAEARRAALKIRDRGFAPGAVPAAIANRFHHAIMAVSGNSDPFASRKAAETAYLGRIFRNLAAQYDNDLESLFRLAVAGNAIDFFREEQEVIRDLAGRVEFGVSELEVFRRRLQGRPGLLLYLADNAGEQFFDAPLVGHLRGSGWRVLYVVKAGPIQNDLTREDLWASGLGEALEPLADTGARTVGLELDQVSSDFLELYDQAGIILAKGMGHFETMSHLPDRRLYFLLQAKCAPVAQALGVSRGSFVFCRTPAISLDKEEGRG